jgi:porphobilinogen synthase
VSNLNIRPRRNRKSQGIRDLVCETRLTLNDIIAPLFCVDRNGYKSEIKSMPGQFRFGPDLLLEEINSLYDQGIKCISLFPAIDESLKNSQASEAYNPNGFNQRMISQIKEQFSDLVVMSDIALDPYSSDGHDGLVNQATGEILNDETLEVLGKMALAQARSGTDILGPSDMMDGRVGYLRAILDQNNFKNVSIIL